MNQTPDRSRAARSLPFLIALALVGMVFAADVASGTELSLSLFYLLPVATAAWFLGRGPALLVAALSGAGWYAANRLDATWAGRPGWILGWNVGIETGVNLTVALAVDALRRGFDRERAMGRQLEAAFARLDREHRAVGELQRELLPASAPESPHWEFAVHYSTSTRAGGDYYDFFPLADGRCGIVVADASGHGAPAAVVMAMVRALLHAPPVEPSAPRATLEALGRRLYGNMPAGVFATACWIELDPAARTLTYALAGHCPPILIRADGRVETLDQGGGPPLGITPAAAYPDSVTRLGPGDTLFVYTDGLTEARDARDEMYGERRLRGVLASLDGAGAAECSERVHASLEAHLGGTSPDDDITWLVVRARSAHEDGATRAPA